MLLPASKNIKLAMSHTLTWLSSLLLRAGSFFFLRWIPGHHFPPLIFGCLAVYLASLLHVVSDAEERELALRKLRHILHRPNRHVGVVEG